MLKKKKKAKNADKEKEGNPLPQAFIQKRL